jgi:hypothetical protein
MQGRPLEDPAFVNAGQGLLSMTQMSWLKEMKVEKV